MRNEDEYLDALRDLVNDKGHTLPEAFSVLEEALQVFPASSELWCLRGDLIAGSDGVRHALGEALASYEQAVLLNPSCAEAYHAIGNYYDVFTDDLKRSEEAFRKALGLWAASESVAGLARVLAQRGQREEALSLLAGHPIPSDPDIEVMRREILDGIWDPISE
jgi:tetratricopeptide (TPR) repeat protein